MKFAEDAIRRIAGNMLADPDRGDRDRMFADEIRQLRSVDDPLMNAVADLYDRGYRRIVADWREELGVEIDRVITAARAQVHVAAQSLAETVTGLDLDPAAARDLQIEILSEFTSTFVMFLDAATRATALRRRGDA